MAIHTRACRHTVESQRGAPPSERGTPVEVRSHRSAGPELHVGLNKTKEEKLEKFEMILPVHAFSRFHARSLLGRALQVPTNLGK